MSDELNPASAPALAAVDITELRILVIESSEFQRRILMRILDSLGVVTVREAENVLKALLLLEMEPIDLVVCSHAPPSIDVLDLLRSLGGVGQTCSVILTGSLDTDTVRTVTTLGRELGVPVLGALERPISGAHLQEMLQQHGQGSQTSAPAITRMSEGDIARGLDSDEFCLHYQPTVSLKNGALVGCEALLRWEHPDMGLLSPAAFLRSMQHRDVMERITLTVFEKALRDLQKWIAQGLWLGLYVNLSEKFLCQRTASNLLLGVCSDFPEVEPRMITFDVTEEALVDAPELLVANLSRLRAKGFGLALDNFAACIPSDRLSNLPFTEIKINPSMVFGTAQKKDAQAAFQACLKVGTDLSLITVAEGVERGEDWDFVANAGCHLAQGYFIAKPMESTAFLAWIKSRTPEPARVADESLGARKRTGGTVPPPTPSGPDGPLQAEVGMVVGHYRLESLLGQGGFGKVFLGTDMRLLRPVAVKVLLDAELGRDKIERFVQEARSLARVQHPGIVTIHEIGQEPFQYMVMELLDGVELAHILKNHGALSPPQAHHLVVQMLDALQAVHAKGIVHRDLKPSNIMIDSVGRVRIMDFGIAKVLDDDRKLTQTGTFCGTPEYMSPEQVDIEHGGVDERTDLFAVGTILYEMLTGKFTLKTGGIHQVLTQLLWTVPVPPHEVNPAVPESFSLICMKALEKQKSDRYANAGEMLSALRAVVF